MQRHRTTDWAPGSGPNPPRPPSVDKGGTGGDDGRMEARLKALEDANLETRDRLARIETRLDAFATKADLHEALHALTWKIVGSCALLVAATYTVVKYVH